MEKILVSACLLGEKVKYNGGDNRVDEKSLEKLYKNYQIVPFCPEVAGGMSTPREPAEIKDGKVITKSQEEVTKFFSDGAELALQICKKEGIKTALLKDGSPSCGSSYIYDGTFTKTKINQEGLTAKLLRENGIFVFCENEL